MFNNDFIEIFDNILSRDECKTIINKFDNFDKNRHSKIIESCSYKQESSCKREVSKKCTQITFDLSKKEDIFYHRFVKKAILKSLPLYTKRYPFLKIGGDCNEFHLTSLYNFQKYTDGEGYYKLHCEHGPLAPYRMLVWTLYLNDAKSGTEFTTQKKIVKPKTGRMIIWPASWTHPHRGVTPNKGLKYILTGWWNFQPQFKDNSLDVYDIRSTHIPFGEY
tara:strand:- start:1710 stop:2369 length:660 start_codon:yes stop_codon:yes gene_type:complete